MALSATALFLLAGAALRSAPPGASLPLGVVSAYRRTAGARARTFAPTFAPVWLARRARRAAARAFRLPFCLFNTPNACRHSSPPAMLYAMVLYRLPLPRGAPLPHAILLPACYAGCTPRTNALYRARVACCAQRCMPARCALRYFCALPAVLCIFYLVLFAAHIYFAFAPPLLCSRAARAPAAVRARHAAFLRARWFIARAIGTMLPFMRARAYARAWRLRINCARAASTHMGGALTFVRRARCRAACTIA